MSATPERAIIQIAGLTAVVECYAWEDDPDQRGRKRLRVLGLVGTRQVHEAIWANLIQGREAVIAPRAPGGGRFCALAPLGAGRWKSHVAALNETSGATATPAEAADMRAFEASPREPSSAARSLRWPVTQSTAGDLRWPIATGDTGAC